MFITLRCDKEKVSVEQASASTAWGTRPRHGACNNCRVKKLKCSGDKTACAACLSNNVLCSYSAQGSQSKTQRTTGTRPRKPSRSQSAVTKPNTNTAPTAANPTTPPTTVASSLASTETDADQFSFTNESSISGKDQSLFDPFWIESPSTDWDDFPSKALDSALNDAGNLLFSDQEVVDLFQRSKSISTSLSAETGLCSNLNDAFSSISPDFFRSQDLDLDCALMGQHYDDEATHSLRSRDEIQDLAFPQLLPSNLKSTSDTDTQHHPPCDCMAHALSTLDKLETQKVAAFHSNANTISAILASNKSALAQCNLLLDCPRCHYKPGSALLLILISRNLVSQFQRLLSVHGPTYSDTATNTNTHTHTHTNNYNTHTHAPMLSSSSSSSSITSHALSEPPSRGGFDFLNGRPAASLGNYCIDTFEEQIQMLHALAIVRGRSMALFLHRLKGVVSFRQCGGNRLKIEGIETWHRGLMESLRKMGEGAL